MVGDGRHAKWSASTRAGSIAVAVAAVLAFLALASAIDGDRASDAEESLFRALNGLPSFLAYPLWPFMQIGNLLVMPAAAVVAGWTRRFRLAVALLLAAGVKLQVTKLIKDEWVRHRPAVFLDDVDVRVGGTASGLGFVSGHAVIAVALGTLVHPSLTNRVQRAALWAGIALVLAGRVYVGAHLPLDVICGGLVGLAIGAALNAVLGVTRSRRAP